MEAIRHSFLPGQLQASFSFRSNSSISSGVGGGGFFQLSTSGASSGKPSVVRPRSAKAFISAGLGKDPPNGLYSASAIRHAFLIWSSVKTSSGRR